MWAAVGRKKTRNVECVRRRLQAKTTHCERGFDAVPLFHALALLTAMGVLATNVDTWGTACIDDAALDGWLTSLRTWEVQHAPGWRP